MAHAIWVNIRKTENDCIASTMSFDTDDTSLGMSVGYVDGWAAAHNLLKVDVSSHGIERYNLVDSYGKARFTVAITSR